MDPYTVLVTPAVTQVLVQVRETLARRLATHERHWSDVLGNSDTYVTAVLNWAANIQMYGMTDPVDTGTHSVPLRIGEPRRFRSRTGNTRERGETELLTSQGHYVILGDPGAGKTTLLKRLTRQVLTSEPLSAGDTYRHPVVVRLREHLAVPSLYIMIANTVGLAFTRGDNADSAPKVGKEPLEGVVAELLNALDAVLMLDGLDEMPDDTRRMVEREVVSLANRLSTAKVLVTARTGDFGRLIEGFSVVELVPLKPSQVTLIARKWARDSRHFLHVLANSPYKDLANRPLLLAQLIMLYNRQSGLPDRPGDVYRRLLRILLEDWDKQRDLERASKYAKFDADQKNDFLSALAYELTFHAKVTSFTQDVLDSIYTRIHNKFRLPAGESAMVAEEIASHTGIIVPTGAGFEFSHLSLQEYLAASYIVRHPAPYHLERYLAEGPAPLAVAVAISLEPAEWLGVLILRGTNYHAFSREARVSFFARLRVERPIFTESTAFGMTLLKLHHAGLSDMDLATEVAWLFEESAAPPSIALALRFYTVQPQESNDNVVVLRAFGKLPSKYGVETPPKVTAPLSLIAALVSGGTTLTWEVGNGERREVHVEDSRLVFRHR
jgi:hypothetical protein